MPKNSKGNQIAVKIYQQKHLKCTEHPRADMKATIRESGQKFDKGSFLLCMVE